MLLRHAIVWLLIAVATTGCDQITGAAEQKSSDAEAIGYACRVSLKKPEDCMKENEAQSTASVLTGWKAADKDIQEKTLDPSMGSDPSMAIQAASAPDETKDEKSAKKGEEATAGKAESAEPEKKPKKSH
ncbi:MAG: hypothetical protein Q8K61_04000 [Gallionella sp.]|jgi:hypothetical protein|nr:hypothetical protein [Gallionella sp.]